MWSRWRVARGGIVVVVAAGAAFATVMTVAPTAGRATTTGSAPPDPMFASDAAAPPRRGETRPSWTPVVGSARVCVHARDAVAATRAETTLVAAERALGLVAASGLPAPPPDAGRGGSYALDLYLESGPRAEARAVLDPVAGVLSPFDRGPAFVRVALPWHAPECAVSTTATEAVVAATWIGLDAAPSPATVRAHAGYVAQAWAPCRPLLAAAVDAAQRRPERALLSHEAPLLGWFIEDRFGVGPVGTVSSSLWAVGAQPSRPGSHHHDEPDLFDVLREVMPTRHKTLGEMLLDLAVARAFMGSRSDGQHLEDTRWLGDLGRIRFDWRLDYASLPRRVAPPHPLAPTGASYVWIDLQDQVPAGHGLTLQATWETSHVFEWAIVRLDAAGRSLGAHRAGGVFGAHEAFTTLETLDGASYLLVVAVHVGNDDRQRPYDPDAGPPRVTSYELTLRPRAP
ncbi:MAG: hypothetical protein AAGN82_12935 [Myxococcota bacterium]